MTSIRARLFVILLAATGAIWLCALMWIQYSTRTEVGHVLDRRLEETARMVVSLIARSGGIVTPDAAALVEYAPALGDGGSPILARQLVCQVWGIDGQLRSASGGAPAERLSEGETGFSERTVEGEVWRVYTLVDADLGIRVMVGDARSVREGLVNRVILGLLAPALVILPLLAVLIWLALLRGLRPLDELARALSGRAATDLSPLEGLASPAELRPMVRSLNDLIRRVGVARERERNFTAFAAHELKTPLAGLKTQAQIAAIAPDAATRDRALAQIAVGVARTDRMVRQLLDMTAADSAETASGTPQDGARILAEVIETLEPLAQARGVEFETRIKGAPWPTDQGVLLAPALRNLLENALIASPASATVVAEMEVGAGRATFRILDRGRGIPEGDRPRVTERFWRGAADAPGSGLGLAIVAAAAGRMGADFTLTPRHGGGECAQLVIPLACTRGGDRPCAPPANPLSAA